jgi:hypothetical protein
VQITTVDPGFPSLASATEVKTAGPRAVEPVSSIPKILSYKAFFVSLTVLFNRFAACSYPFFRR